MKDGPSLLTLWTVKDSKGVNTMDTSLITNLVIQVKQTDS